MPRRKPNHTHTCLISLRFSISRFAITILYICLVTILSCSSIFAWTLWDDCDSHYWMGPGWGGRSVSLSSYTFLDHDCLRVTCLDNTANYACTATKWFPDENWQNSVELFRAEVYLVSSSSNTTIKFESKDHNDTQIQGIWSAEIDTGTWLDIGWDIDQSLAGYSNIARVILTPDSLGTNECTYYFDNLRLVMTDGTTEYWDDMNDRSRQWSYNGDYYIWNAGGDGMEPISHRVSTTTTNAGSAHLQWGSTTYGYAELVAAGLSGDWSSYNMLRANIYCSDTGIPLKFYLWYGDHGEDTPYRYVSISNTWETIAWPLPAGTSAYTITEFKPGVVPSALHLSGTYYIDNIWLGYVDITMSKSTSTASGLPGDEVTYTITYGNSGTDSADNIYITDAVPFYTYISEGAAIGDANTVEYYVGSAWQSGYDASATKVRWLDYEVVGSTSGLDVQYKVKIK